MKRKIKPLISYLLATSLLLGLATAMPVSVSAEILNFNYSDFTVEYNIVNSWADNQNVNVTLTNTGDTPIRNWALQYDFCGTITGIWNGEIYGDNVVKSVQHNSDIAVGASVSFGYSLSNVSGTPNAFSLCNYRVEKQSGYTVELITMPDWGSGFTGIITIENTASEPIMAWELSFDANFTVTQAENFSILESAGNSYRVTGIHNGNIPANSSVALQFNAASAPNPAITDVSLTEVVVSINSGSASENEQDYGDYVFPENYYDDEAGVIFFKDFASLDDIEYDGEGIYYIKNQFLLTAKPEVSFYDIRRLVKEMGGEIVGFIDIINDYQIEMEGEVSDAELYSIIDELLENDMVDYASLNTAFEIEEDSIDSCPDHYHPNDSHYDDASWSDVSSNEKWGLVAIKAPEAWGHISHMQKVKLGVIDDAFYRRYGDDNDLTIKKAWNNPDNDYIKIKDLSHGTKVFGIMAANFDNGKGLSGVVPNRDLYVYSYSGSSDKISQTLKENQDEIDERDYGTHMSLMEYKYAISLFVANGVKVINVSLTTGATLAYAAQFGLSPAKGIALRNITVNAKNLKTFLETLKSSGYDFLIVTSAGNENDNQFRQSSESWGYSNVGNYINQNNKSDAQYNNYLNFITGSVADSIIVVGAIERQTSEISEHVPGDVPATYRYTNYSNVGDRVDVVAPGTDIYHLTVDDDKYAIPGFGTSFAAPHVSGTAGMMYSVNPNLKSEQVKEIIVNSARNNDSKVIDDLNDYEYYLVDAKTSVETAINTAGLSPQKNNGGAVVCGMVYENIFNFWRKDTQEALTNVDISVFKYQPTNGGYSDAEFVKRFLNPQRDFELVLEDGKYGIVFQKGGYAPNMFYVNVKQGEVIYQDIILYRENAESYRIEGKVIDCVTGRSIPNASVKILRYWDYGMGVSRFETSFEYFEDWGDPWESITDANGKFTRANLSAGCYALEIEAAGYAKSYFNFVPYTDSRIPTFALSPALQENEYRIVLNWGASPADLDSHLTNSSDIHVYYSNKSYVRGNVVVRLDRDVTSGYGPETTTLFIDPNNPQTYTFYVYNYSGERAISSSGAKVVVYWNGGSETYSVPVNKSGRYWTVFSIENGEIKYKNLIS